SRDSMWFLVCRKEKGWIALNRLPRQIRDALIAQASLVRYEFDAAAHIRLIDPDDQDELALAAPPITSMRCSCTGPSRVMRFGARPRRCTRSGLGLGRRLSDPWPSLRHIRSRNPFPVAREVRPLPQIRPRMFPPRGPTW